MATAVAQKALNAFKMYSDADINDILSSLPATSWKSPDMKLCKRLGKKYGRSDKAIRNIFSIASSPASAIEKHHTDRKADGRGFDTHWDRVWKLGQKIQSPQTEVKPSSAQTRHWNLGGFISTVTIPPMMTKANFMKFKEYVDALEIEASIAWM
jgi:hypothetical protein